MTHCLTRLQVVHLKEGSGVRNKQTSQFMSRRNSDEHDVEGKLNKKSQSFEKPTAR